MKKREKVEERVKKEDIWERARKAFSQIDLEKYPSARIREASTIDEMVEILLGWK